ncbi:MAG: hypothetical protein E6I93_20080 [Chloroflexi bacterium]|nr:MAG: hypothetical protein E6I93_20080 [Chloroflexota bacterium]
MSTTVFSHNSTALGNELERGTSHDAPLLLTLNEHAADELPARSFVFEIVSQLTRLAAQRLPVTAASPLCHTSQAGEERPFADQVFTTVSACLQQGFRRLLLVPWGGRQGMGPLAESAMLALSTVTGEAVSQAELALPHVQVEGVSARSALGGLSSIQTQLGPLLEAFPGWDRSWVRLSAGKTTILLLRSGKGTEQPSPVATAWEEPTLKALAATLCPQQAGIMTARERLRWQRDGDIYARYLVSLLGAATDFLQQE